MCRFCKHPISYTVTEKRIESESMAAAIRKIKRAHKRDLRAIKAEEYWERFMEQDFADKMEAFRIADHDRKLEILERMDPSDRYQAVDGLPIQEKMSLLGMTALQLFKASQITAEELRNEDPISYDEEIDNSEKGEGLTPGEILENFGESLSKEDKRELQLRIAEG